MRWALDSLTHPSPQPPSPWGVLGKGVLAGKLLQVRDSDLGFFFIIPRIATVPTDPGSVSQTLGGGSSRNLTIPQPGMLALWKLGRRCYFMPVV